VSAHHDEIRFRRLCDAQNAVECVAGNHSRAAADSTQLGDCADLLKENPFGFAGFDLYQCCRLILIYDVQQRKLGTAPLRQKTGPAQRPVGTSRQVRRY
jgi:hypothetical protein